MARFILFAALVACSVFMVTCSGSTCFDSDASERKPKSESEDKNSESPRGDVSIVSGEEDSAELKCGPNEVEDTCPSNCLSNRCPRSEAESQAQLAQSCPTPNPCPKPACKCAFNYRQGPNGTCIPTRECPPFACIGKYRVFNPCPPICPDGSCAQATPTGECPAQFGHIGIVLPCNPTCRCKEGYWEDKNKGKCVPYQECPNVS